MDYAWVNSPEAAEKLAARGELFKMLLQPLEFGGEDSPQNTAYVPPGAPAIVRELIASFLRLRTGGVIDRLQVQPEYRRDSVVPCAIHIKAWKAGEEAAFTPCFEIW